jgi:hypothetical protein
LGLSIVLLSALIVVMVGSIGSSNNEPGSLTMAELREQRHEKVLDTPPPPQFLITEKSIGPVKLEMTMSEVESIWGQPQSKEIERYDASPSSPEEIRSTYRMPGGEILLTFENESEGWSYEPSRIMVLFGFYSRNRKFRDRYGHGVGSLISTVAAAYGTYEPSESDESFDNRGFPVAVGGFGNYIDYNGGYGDDGLWYVGSSENRESEVLLIQAGDTEGFFGSIYEEIMLSMGVTWYFE